MKTLDDVTNAFRAIRFVERTAALAEKYRRISGKKEFKPRQQGMM